eukprot:TRINITY_DN4160_c1_g3_i2.p1 TRINITY_DN4160_c1_g3~~TRINITY_DN4160_c1_g3_i2.p1  ORF type:complete len:105 (+),score=22.18 TRINITY_DN4160_c1_g3_i2:67-381(+)
MTVNEDVSLFNFEEIFKWINSCLEETGHPHVDVKFIKPILSREIINAFVRIMHYATQRTSPYHDDLQLQWDNQRQSLFLLVDFFSRAPTTPTTTTPTTNLTQQR